VVFNGGFESGLYGWFIGGFPFLSSAVTHSGYFSAGLGGYNNAYDFLGEGVVVPSCARSGAIQYWLYPVTTASTSGLLDDLRVRIDDLQVGILYLGDNYIDPSNQATWRSRQDPVSNVAAAQGHGVTLSIEAFTDSTFWSGWYVDDVSLTFSC
jgi:hypothetical protein